MSKVPGKAAPAGGPGRHPCPLALVCFCFVSSSPTRGPTDVPGSAFKKKRAAEGVSQQVSPRSCCDGGPRPTKRSLWALQDEAAVALGARFCRVRPGRGRAGAAGRRRGRGLGAARLLPACPPGASPGPLGEGPAPVSRSWQGKQGHRPREVTSGSTRHAHGSQLGLRWRRRLPCRRDVGLFA